MWTHEHWALERDSTGLVFADGIGGILRDETATRRKR